MIEENAIDSLDLSHLSYVENSNFGSDNQLGFGFGNNNGARVDSMNSD